MALAAGSYRGRVGSQAYPQNFLRQYDESVYRPSAFGALLPMRVQTLGRVALRRRRRRYRSIGLLGLFGL
jgi:hypothetical protein